YHVQRGIFMDLCMEATKNPDVTFAIVIDDINRVNITRILGELLLLLEYRDMSVVLPYSKEPFLIPENVFVLGTMNTTDRSLSVIDYALRRRFYFYRLLPVEDGDAPVLRGWLQREGTASANDILRLFIRLNQKVQEDLGEHFQIGHSYLMRPDIGERTAQEQVWRRAIVPLLEEYFYPRKSRQQIEDEYGIDALLRGPEPPAPTDEV